MKIWVKYVQDSPPSHYGMLAPEGVLVAAAIKSCFRVVHVRGSLTARATLTEWPT
jgi:hypothetical protein